MSISLKEVKKIAELARLYFDEGELTVYCEHLNEILNYVDKLNELETDHVEPTYSVQSDPETMREDRKKPTRFSVPLVQEAVCRTLLMGEANSESKIQNHRCDSRQISVEPPARQTPQAHRGQTDDSVGL